MSNHSYEGGNTLEDRYNVECCDASCIHDDIIQKVQQDLPDEDTLYDLTELFRIFGDSTRIRILYVLFEAEVCVCDIAELLGMTQSAISHQLRALKNARLVKSRREGKTVFYSLADDHVKTIIDQGLEHVSE
nr:metalloregulator ArsR/SmtB family transcription factor [Oscillibacter sp. PC13]